MLNISFKHSVLIVVATICLSGFTVQVGNVTSRYFGYKTRTIVEMKVPDEISMPSLSVCFRINDIMVFDNVKQKYNREGLKHFKEGGFDWQRFYRDTRDFRVKDWFQFTPSTTNVFKHQSACRIRFPSKYSPEEHSQSDCFSIFKIAKYFDREFVCYSFKPMFQNQTLDLIEYTMTPGSTGIMYEIFFDDAFFRSYEMVSVSVHTNDSSYLYDTVFASSHKFSGGHHNIDIHYNEIERLRLKYPYDTQCVDVPRGFRTGAEYRLHQVNEESLKYLDRVIPFIPNYDADLDRKIFTVDDFKNGTLVRELNKMFQSIFKLTECYTKYFITKGKASGDRFFQASVLWPQDEKMTLKYVPQEDLIDYIVYVGSCVGMWFGFSALSIIDAFNLVRKSIASNNTPEGSAIPDHNLLTDAYRWRLNREITNLKNEIVDLKRRFQ